MLLAPSKLLLFSSFLPLLFPLSSNAQQTALTCNSCGSTLLRSQWQATGLPTLPPTDRFHFDDECEDNTKNSPKVNCTSICMEMVLVAGGEYTVVRGCLSDFYEGYNLPNLSPTCNYAQYDQALTMFENNEPRILSKVNVGTSYCNTPNCNTELKGDIGFASGFTAWQGTKFCGTEYRQTPQIFDCLNCARFDWDGECDWDYKRYCNGQWCTKTIGYVNGRWVENRGCAPINPAGTSICVKLESTHEISQMGNHPLTLPYSMEQCYCQQGRCNGAITGMPFFGGILAISLSLLIWTIIFSQ